MNQYTSIKLILDKLMRHPLLLDLTLETVVDYTVDFMRIVGVPNMFINKIEKVELDDWRGKLPCDIYLIILIRDAKNKSAYRYTSDSFQLAPNDKKPPTDLTYKVQGDVIYTSVKKGEIEISYQAFAVDKDGYPLLPDNSSFTRALELYIKLQWFTILFDLGKISPAVLLNTQLQYSWAVGDCQTEFNRLTIDQMESFTNMWNTLIIRANAHKTGFKDNGSKEHLKLQ